METERILSFLNEQLSPVLNESGSIIFSSVNTLKRGNLYTLGLNPGGEFFKPISQIIDELPDKIQNAYLDENWGNRRNNQYQKGEHPLQNNFIKLLNALGFDPTEVFSANLIFIRSRGQKGANYSTNADLCWSVHQKFIKIVDPDCFIVFGNSKISPFQYIKTRYELPSPESISSGHGNWRCHYTNGIIEGRQRSVIGIPHLSRYYITYHPEVIQWISIKLQGK